MIHGAPPLRNRARRNAGRQAGCVPASGEQWNPCSMISCSLSHPKPLAAPAAARPGHDPRSVQVEPQRNFPRLDAWKAAYEELDPKIAAYAALQGTLDGGAIGCWPRCAVATRSDNSNTRSGTSRRSGTTRISATTR